MNVTHQFKIFLRNVMRSLLSSLLISSLVLLTGCAGLDVAKDTLTSITDLFADEDSADPPATIPEEYQAEVETELIWKEVIGKGVDQKNLKLIPVVQDNKLYVAEHKGLIQARNTVDGELIWENHTEFLFSAGPSLSSDLVIMGSSHGEVVAFDKFNGELKWRSPVPSEVLTVPVVYKNKILVRTTDGKTLALNLNDGSLIWSAEQSVPPLSIRGAAIPLVSNDTVYLGGANGKMVALQLADGKLLWEATIAIPTGRSEVERIVDIDADPLEAKGSLFISSYQNGAAAISEIDGDILWRNDNISTYSGISSDNRYLYLSDAHSEIWQLDQRNGFSLWKQKELHNRGLSAVTVYQSYLVVGDFEGYVHWLSTSDGHIVGRIKIGKSPIQARPLVVDGIVYVYAKDGTLAALRVK